MSTPPRRRRLDDLEAPSSWGSSKEIMGKRRIKDLSYCERGRYYRQRYREKCAELTRQVASLHDEVDGLMRKKAQWKKQLCRSDDSLPGRHEHVQPQLHLQRRTSIHNNQDVIVPMQVELQLIALLRKYFEVFDHGTSTPRVKKEPTTSTIDQQHGKSDPDCWQQDLSRDQVTIMTRLLRDDVAFAGQNGIHHVANYWNRLAREYAQVQLEVAEPIQVVGDESAPIAIVRAVLYVQHRAETLRSMFPNVHDDKDLCKLRESIVCYPCVHRFYFDQRQTSGHETQDDVGPTKSSVDVKRRMAKRARRSLSGKCVMASRVYQAAWYDIEVDSTAQIRDGEVDHSSKGNGLEMMKDGGVIDESLDNENSS